MVILLIQKFKIMKSTIHAYKKNTILQLSKTSILSFILFFVIVSCNNNDEPSSSFTPQNIPFTLIGKSYMFSPTNISQQNTIIDNQTQWSNLLNQMNSGVWDPFTTTTIDFTNYMLIAIIDIDGRPHTGYTVTINSITEYENDIVVDFSTNGSQNGFAATTQPYHIVKIPIQTKPIVFQ